MPNVLAAGDLDRIASRIGAWIAGSVAASPTPTATQFAVTGYDFTAAPSLAGALVVVGHTVRQVGQVASNSGATLTLQAALASAPAVGDPVLIFPQVAVNFSGSENVAEVGGQPVPRPGTAYSGPVLPVGGNDGTNARAVLTDTNGRVVESALAQSTGAPATAAPPHAVQVGGSDGTDLRTLLTTAGGRLNLALTVATVAAVAESANTNFAGFTAPHDGVATLLIAVSAAASVSLVALGMTATLNGGATLNAGQWYAFQFPVAAGQSYALQVGTAVTVSCHIVVNTTG